MHIHPHRGLDDTLFGMSQEQVRLIHGSPEESKTQAEDEDETLAWYFWSEGFSLHFDSDADWRLTTIEVASPEAHLGLQPLIGIGLPELLAYLRTESRPFEEVDLEEDGYQLIEVPSWDLNFWLEDGLVAYVQWGVPVDEGGQAIWPPG